MVNSYQLLNSFENYNTNQEKHPETIGFSFFHDHTKIGQKEATMMIRIVMIFYDKML